MGADTKPARKRKGRRARGDGAVFFSKSKNCWVWRAVTGRKPGGGVAYTEGRARTQAAGLAAKQAAEREGRLPGADALTVGAYLDHWLDNVAKSGTRRNTWARYEQVVRLHLKTRVGGVPLAKLDTRAVNKLWGDLSRDGMSPAMVRKCSEVFASCLEHAVREGTIPTAPTRSAAKPKVIKVPIEVFTDDEVRAILDAAAGRRLEALFTLVLASGMREAELFALDVTDLDLAAGTVHVRRSLDRRNGSIVLYPPKSATGVRVVDLPPFALTPLRAHVGDRTAGIVFMTGEGTYLHFSNFIRRDWQPLLGAAGVKYRKFHTTRHTHASRLLASGVDPAEVARRIGDKIETLMRTYAHWMPTVGRNTAAKVESLYGGGKVAGDDVGR